jgi:xanthine/uracil permease
MKMKETGIMLFLSLLISYFLGFVFGFMMFNATFNNISVISWRSVLLVEKTGVTRKNNRPAVIH